METLWLIPAVAMCLILVFGPFFFFDYYSRLRKKHSIKKALIKKIQNLNFQEIDDFFSELNKVYNQNRYISNFDLFNLFRKYQKIDLKKRLA